MIDKENIKTTDWLTKGISPEKLEKEKAKAIKSAEKELARKEKRAKKKSLYAYDKMCRRHKKELVELATKVRPFDWGWLDELVLVQIKHMHEYFAAGNNVWQTDETRLPIVEQLKHVLDLYEEVDNLDETYPSKMIHNDDGTVCSTDESAQVYLKREERRVELYEEIYSYIGKVILYWWD